VFRGATTESVGLVGRFCETIGGRMSVARSFTRCYISVLNRFGLYQSSLGVDLTWLVSTCYCL
jgi:hypothetical protein